MMLSGRLMEYARQCVRDGVFGILQEAVLSEFAHEITVLEAIAGDKVILNEQCAALESRIEELESVVAAKQNIIKGIQRTVNDHLDAEVALAAEEKKP